MLAKTGCWVVRPERFLKDPGLPECTTEPAFSLCRLFFFHSTFSPQSSFKLLTTEALQSSPRRIHELHLGISLFFFDDFGWLRVGCAGGFLQFQPIFFNFGYNVLLGPEIEAHE